MGGRDGGDTENSIYCSHVIIFELKILSLDLKVAIRDVTSFIKRVQYYDT